MASEEHKYLASFIKETHSNLRIKSKELGFDNAWKEHCNDLGKLQKYANSMRKLAIEHWDENARSNLKVVSRVEWIYKFCMEYFFNGGILKYRKKEDEVLHKIEEICETSYINDYVKLRLIDVGSCYNPFSKYEDFEIIPLDIAPACKDVYKCDFLNVKIGKEDKFEDNSIVQLKSNSYHVVAFSLLLEYLPSPKQRLLCCENAYNLLEPEGILVIITPDSKHVGANAKYMKSWRYCLSLIGFSRICYEKLPYLHCIVFRKSIHSAYPRRWAQMHKDDNLFQDLHIPQDFQETEEIQDEVNVPQDKRLNLLPELPFCNLYQ